MKAATRSARQPVLAAFVTWFAHFLLCWAAVEIWPHEWRANELAWAFTAVALLVMFVCLRRLDRSAARGEIAAPARRVARGAIGIATVAVVFTALPSVVLLP